MKNGTAVSRDTSSVASEIVSSSSVKATPSSSLNAAPTLVQSLSALTSTTQASLSPATKPAPTLGQSLSALTSTAQASLSPARKPARQTGVIVGAAIGGAAVLALTTGAIVLIGMRRIKHKSQSQETPQKTWRDESQQYHETFEASTNNTARELDTDGPVPELENSRNSQRLVPELPNSECHRPVQELQGSTRSHGR